LRGNEGPFRESFSSTAQFSLQIVDPPEPAGIPEDTFARANATGGYVDHEHTETDVPFLEGTVTCTTDSTHDLTTVTGPQPANPEQPYIGVKVQMNVEARTYFVTTSGVNLTGPTTSSGGGPNPPCNTFNLPGTDNFWFGFGFGEARPWPANLTHLRGTHLVLTDDGSESMTWNLDFVDFLDEDGNGVPDRWQDTDGDGDFDLTDPDDDDDSWSDVDEKAAGSDPKDESSTPEDTDGDGIPDFRDEDDDNDGWSDAEEIAAGSNPKDPGSTPDDPGGGGNDSDGDGVRDSDDWCSDTPTGAVVGPSGCSDNGVQGTFPLHGTGDLGMTCGTARFDWVTIAGQETAVQDGERACVVLFSNRLLQEAFRTATQAGIALSDSFGEYLVANGIALAAREASQKLIETGATTLLVRALFPEMAHVILRANLVSTAIAVIEQATLVHGVIEFAAIAIPQIFDHDACYQLTIAVDDDQLQLDGMLVYNPAHFDDRSATLAHTFEKRSRPFQLDRYVQRNLNMRCDETGSVRMGGQRATGTVFHGPLQSWLFAAAA
jgi:hypothetical protein